MKRVLYGATALAALAAATPAAFATDGAYGRVDLGYTFDGEVEADAPGVSADLDEDIAGFAGLGYAFDNGFRIEGELAFRDNELDLTAPATGEASVDSLMANVYYDFNKGGTIQPYLGLGAGYADVQGSSPVLVFDDEVAAYQGLAGVAFGLSEQLTLDVGYRYFHAPDVGAVGGLPGGPAVDEIDYTAQTATVGLRWQFASPAPPPPPPAPPPPPPPPVTTCPTADFVVYFEWDRADLNQAALQTIDAAIAQARNCNLGAVSVIGHTDTSGSAAYNVGLSERRASVVRDAIVARGIADASVTTAAKGETELARETPDGTREPLNRRAAVTISFR